MAIVEGGVVGLLRWMDLRGFVDGQRVARDYELIHRGKDIEVSEEQMRALRNWRMKQANPWAIFHRAWRRGIAGCQVLDTTASLHVKGHLFTLTGVEPGCLVLDMESFYAHHGIGAKAKEVVPMGPAEIVVRADAKFTDAPPVELSQKIVLERIDRHGTAILYSLVKEAEADCDCREGFSLSSRCVADARDPSP